MRKRKKDLSLHVDLIFFMTMLGQSGATVQSQMAERGVGRKICSAWPCLGVFVILTEKL